MASYPTKTTKHAPHAVGALLQRERHQLLLFSLLLLALPLVERRKEEPVFFPLFLFPFLFVS